MYDLKAIFQKEPVVIAGTIRSVLFVLVLAGLIVLDEKLLAAIALGAELVLGLFVHQASTSFRYPTLDAGTEASITGSDDKVVIKKTPPGPEGIPSEEG